MSTPAIRPIRKLLVVNRGEIAIRIFRACTEMSISTVAVYSHADRLSIHRYKADEAWQIGGEDDPYQAYLDADQIIALAKERNVDAIHPGYGFLSERADFARRCRDAGIIFIGPTPESIDGLGDKVAARALATRANVPIIPGSDGPLDDEKAALAFANKIGYPVMLKAAHGGGGRGMRRCENGDDVVEGFVSATREALQAFGKGEIFIEKFVVQPRHIEVQLLGDVEGNVVHLFERDCSVQRRHQKVVEVAPALGLADEMRQKLFNAAVKIAKEAKLSCAATCEFLVQGDDYYFIEVNPRLQVEHTITEMITGVDIVQSQLLLAAGHLLGSNALGQLQQERIQCRGHAIQARVTTENADQDFAPDTGRVTAYRSAAGFGIRLDTSIAGAGAVITPFYDSMLVKVSAHALTHEDAVRKLRRSLAEFRVRGVATNLSFLENIIRHESFSNGTIDTTFLERTPSLFDLPRHRNRGSLLLFSLANTLVNGPAGTTEKLDRPKILVEPRPPLTLEREYKGVDFKKLLDDKGPEAVAKAVSSEQTLLITDTTFRDAHQSLLATRVRSWDMLRVAQPSESRMRSAFSFECWGGATFDVAFRFLRENPFERLAGLREEMPHTLLQMLLRGSNAVGYTNYPENVIRRFVSLAAREGVDVFRIFDCFNQLDAMRTSIDAVREAGKIAEVSICFTADPFDDDRPLYSFDYYKRKAAECQEAGAHMIALKDMAGLLKPAAAFQLIEAIKAEVDLPLHLHTHDTSGNGVATLLSAAHAGVDIVDAAVASMSGLTSQPSLDALLAALDGSPLRPDIDANELQELSDYWEAVRTQYLPFESGLRASTADVYRHEIPGGQYSNLKPQAMAVGLAEEWPIIRERYREVNFALGDVIKVTPSSKVVGDFALWLVKNQLTVEELLKSEEHYDFPQSLIGFFQGSIGTPEGGFPKELQKRILGHEGDDEGNSSLSAASLPSFDFEKEGKELSQLTDGPVDDTLVIGGALYPNVVRDYLKYLKEHGDTSVLDTTTFLYGLQPEREVIVDIEPGKSLVVSLQAVSELRDDLRREVLLSLNGQPRSVLVKDHDANEGKTSRERADAQNPAHIGVPMPGSLLSLAVSVGDDVKEGEVLAVCEAMKLETSLRAPMDAKVQRIVLNQGDKVQNGDLLIVLEGLAQDSPAS
ncbi:MAG: pyruvate carboxylase [Deltaproteobacteria bacterium]|nr:pyruvate carboxylase [Deltaproteobacteria bacterium]